MRILPVEQRRFLQGLPVLREDPIGTKDRGVIQSSPAFKTNLDGAADFSNGTFNGTFEATGVRFTNNGQKADFNTIRVGNHLFLRVQRMYSGLEAVLELFVKLHQGNNGGIVEVERKYNIGIL